MKSNESWYQRWPGYCIQTGRRPSARGDGVDDDTLISSNILRTPAISPHRSRRTSCLNNARFLTMSLSALHRGRNRVEERARYFASSCFTPLPKWWTWRGSVYRNAARPVKCENSDMATKDYIMKFRISLEIPRPDPTYCFKDIPLLYTILTMPPSSSFTDNLVESLAQGHQLVACDKCSMGTMIQ